MRIKRWHRLWVISGLLILIIAIIATIKIISFPRQKLLQQINHIKSNDIILGDPSAPNSLIVYFDYNCGFCKKFFNEVYPKLDNTVVNEKKLNIIIRLVCNKTDKVTIQAYQTVSCINQFGNFNKLHKLLMHKNEIIYTEHFNQLIDEYIATNENVAECILSSNSQQIIQNIFQLQELKTNGTPTFVVNDKVIVGYKDYQVFLPMLELE